MVDVVCNPGSESPVKGTALEWTKDTLSVRKGDKQVQTFIFININSGKCKTQMAIERLPTFFGLC